MRKLLALVLVLALALPLLALAEGTYEIALVTDVGNIDDQSFNQYSWLGVKEYAEENGKTYAYYQPSEDSTDARVESITTAVEKGAKAVVLPGFLFADAVSAVQDLFPETTFIVLDTAPASAASKNTYSILYQEEQAGYLAGYAAVKDGFTKLGFLGGMAVPAVVRFGYGFVQGADAAAKEMSIQVDIKYWYANSFAPNDDIKTKMSGWYTEGTEIVFACGGGILFSALAAAEEADKQVIGVDVDQGYISPRVVTSAMKGLTVSVKLALSRLFDNGGVLPEDMQGVTATLGAKDGAVGLPTAPDSWRLKKFTVDEYNALFEKLKSGEVVVSPALEPQPATTNAVVDYQN
ncbi:MAG: BMP family ABC transporter substrate-binding protein [Clostridiales bacterium]|nr:BMP family ABC transporter substrate-binding protein [Clostridiales bacterium]